MFTPVQKYELPDDKRMHTAYTPAAAPLALTDSVIAFADVNTDATLVDATAEHDTVDDAITNAAESPLTFTRPAPAKATDCTTLVAPITLGVTDVTDTTLSDPAVTYTDVDVHRTHSRYDPAAAPDAFTVTLTLDPDPLLDVDVPLTALTLEHDADTTNALESPLTFGIDPPLTTTT